MVTLLIGCRLQNRAAAEKSVDDHWSVTSVAFQSVQLAGISERLPSGSTTSNSRAPRRFMVPISGNERPSNGCRSRSIITELEMSRRWVVCSGFLRLDPARPAPGERDVVCRGRVICLADKTISERSAAQYADLARGLDHDR